MANQQFKTLGVFERAALARAIQTHGVTSVLVEIGSIVKSEATQKALATAVATINKNVQDQKLNQAPIVAG